MNALPNWLDVIKLFYGVLIFADLNTRCALTIDLNV